MDKRISEPAHPKGPFYTMHLRNGKEQFASLDFLRVIASLMIVLFHAHSIAFKHAQHAGEAFFPAPSWWYSCIDLFFTMSGFLMIHMSRNLYGSAQGVKIFTARRASRTPPLYWIYTLLITIIFLVKPSLSVEGPVDLRMFLSSVLFYPDIRNPVIAIGWTLNYEIFFYCIIGLSIYLPFSAGWKFSIAALVSVVALGRILGLHTSPWVVWTDPLMLDFVIGILVAVAYYRGVALKNSGTACLCAVAALLISRFDVHGSMFLQRTMTAGLGMGLIVAAATLRQHPISFGHFSPAVTFLSQQTYTMYLCHILVLKCIELVYFRLLHGFLANIFYIVIGTVITTLVSRILYKIIEKPLTEMLRQRIKKYTSISAPAKSHVP